MAKKNTQVENVAVENNEENGQLVNRNRANMVVALSPETLASIDEAAENFSSLGLNVRSARELVAEEIERLASGVSATALFAVKVQAKLAALTAPKQ